MEPIYRYHDGEIQMSLPRWNRAVWVRSSHDDAEPHELPEYERLEHPARFALRRKFEQKGAK